MPYGRDILADEIGTRDLLRRGSLRLRRLILPPGGLLIAGVPQFDQNMDLHLKDNDKIFFGDDDDSSITYDGTDLVIKPAAVGSGDIVVSGGSIKLDDNEGAIFGADSDGTLQWDGTDIILDKSFVVDATGVAESTVAVGFNIKGPTGASTTPAYPGFRVRLDGTDAGGAGKERLDMGWGGQGGANMEFYSRDHGIRAGRLNLVYGAQGAATGKFLVTANTAVDTWADVLEISVDGRYGIGAAPHASYKMHIKSTLDWLLVLEGNDHCAMRLVGTANSERTYNIYNGANLAWQMGLDNAPSSPDFRADFIIKQTTNANPEFVITTDSLVGISRDGLGAQPVGQLHVEQTSTSAALPVLLLDQRDVSEEGIKFTLNAGTPVDADINLFTVNVTGTPKLLWDESDDDFNFNKGLDITGNIVVSGTVDGVDIAARDHAKYTDAEAVSALETDGTVVKLLAEAYT